MSDGKKPYVPPHRKRHANRNPTPTPVPSYVGYRLHQDASPPVPKIPYSPQLISCWYATSSSESIALVPYYAEAIEKENSSKPLTLTVTDQDQVGLIREETRVLRGIVEKIARDLIEGAQRAKKEKESEDVKLIVMARLGKVLFQGNPSVLLDSIKKTSASKAGDLNKKLAFRTNVSVDYIREVEKFLMEKCEFQSEMAKERFHIKVIDNRQPDLIFSCKCKVSHDSELKLYKVEHNPLLIHMVADVSCVSKNMDLRIMLNTKRTVKNLDVDVESGIRELISAADVVLDVKGGLKWPLGKASVEDRFYIVEVWHTVKRTLSRDKISICLRRANHYDYHSSTGEDATEVSFKLHGLSELLTEDDMHEGSTVDKIQEVVSLIWDNLLS